MKAILKEQTTTIIDRLSYYAQAHPHRVAYEFLWDRGQCESISYQQLEKRVRSLAALLQTRAAAGDRALLMYSYGLEFVSAFLACLCAGIIAVPTPAVSRSRKTQRLKTILDDARPKLILTTAELTSSLDSALTRDTTRDTDDCAIISTDQIESSESHSARPALSADTVAYLQYTSGSTSAPKGAIITHGNIIANCKAAVAGFDFSPESVMVSWLPLFHDMGLLGNILVPLYEGYLSVMMSSNAFIQSPVRWLQAITKYRATCAGGPNFSWDYCVRMVSDNDKQGLDLSSLMTAFNGAEPIRAETIKRFCEAFAAQGFRPEAAFPCYGMAEATLFVSGGPNNRGALISNISNAAIEKNKVVAVSAEDEDARQIVSCGRVWEDTEALIVNPETREVCAPDEVGEIWVSGGSVGKGYWNRPELSEEIFRAHLSSGEGPFLRTGDMGYMQNSELFVTGRRKDMIIVRGRNIYPQDIEATVERVTTFVKANSCAALSVEVGGQEKVVLVVEADRRLARKLDSVRDGSDSRSAESEVAEIIGRITQAVAEEHEILLHAISFVRPGAFPRTSSGKVQRSLCRSRLSDGSLDVI